jgi:hypothetical protein
MPSAAKDVGTEEDGPSDSRSAAGGTKTKSSLNFKQNAKKSRNFIPPWVDLQQYVCFTTGGREIALFGRR